MTSVFSSSCNSFNVCMIWPTDQSSSSIASPSSPTVALASKSIGGSQWNVNHRMGQVDEERIGLVFANELRCFGRVALRQRRLIGRIFNNLVAAHQWYLVTNRFGPRLLFGHPLAKHAVLREASVLRVDCHVIAVGNAEVRVETLLRRQERLAMAEVPLADADRGVALLL